ncbi:MAG: PIN domain-containing protein [Leptolyngbya sp. UWPOB_LEPTO1]|uniref:PIN domain-containing protein n=1 Tax=Leptolyngbya sp. UWPOB_LEPTO1 TaxID=2815653 RepID=UPI001AD29085|nr:PIN domain-containing protein [Leptolyngbya sp. UWPOB_LEPTO1]MBN8561991.1 PIN domain-containing protein [Leptolyngbya sp. UWPOB_LEPTO1]
MRVLFDTNILLDAILTRGPFDTDARFLLTAVELGRIIGFVSATTITDVYYLVRRQTRSAEIAMTTVNRLMELMEICTVDRNVLEQAILSNQSDFEDAVQIACEIALSLDAIVTRDVSGFTDSAIQVLSPNVLRNQVEDAQN